MNRLPLLPSEILTPLDWRYAYAKLGDTLVIWTRWRIRLAIPIAIAVIGLLILFTRTIGLGNVIAPIMLILAGFIVYMLLDSRVCRVPWVYDYRPPILVLRSFSDERSKLGDELPTNVFDARGGKNPYVWQLTQALWDWSRIVMFQLETFDARVSMSAVIIEPVNDWEKAVIKIAERSWLVLIFPASTPSCIRELDLLRDNGLLSKTVLFMPPSQTLSIKLLSLLTGQIPTQSTQADSWEQLRIELLGFGFEFPTYDKKGMLFTPTEAFAINNSISLNNNAYSWKRLRELVPGPGVAEEPLWNTVCNGNAYEAEDKQKRVGNTSVDEGCKVGVPFKPAF
jgi:hypothetical protein